MIDLFNPAILHELQLTKILAILQLPVIGLIVILTFQSSYVLNNPSMRFVAFGWFVNFINMIMFTVFKEVLQANIGQEYYSLLVIYLPLITLLSFIIAISIDKEYSSSYLSMLPLWSLTVLLLLFVDVKIAINYFLSEFPASYHEIVGILAHIPIALLYVYVFLHVGNYYRKLVEREFNNARSILLYVSGGYYLFAMLQINPVFTEYVHGSNKLLYLQIGYLVGLLSKSAILFGLIMLDRKVSILLQRLREERVAHKELQNVLSKMIHEMATPLSHIFVRAQLLSERFGSSGKYSTTISSISSAAARISAITEASKHSMPGLEAKAALLKTKYSEEIRFEPKMEVSSVNTLIEIALMQCKDYHPGQHVDVRLNYARSCCVKVNTYEAIQIFINIINNAYDAIEARKANMYNSVSGISPPVIKITTKTIKASDQDSIVAIDIVDDGDGIEEGLQDKIFEEGFSTRSNSILRGRGLPIVLGMLVINYGDIKLVSPAQNSKEGSYGTKWTITFPLCACKYKRSQ